MTTAIEATTACDLCGGREPLPFGEENGYRLVRCGVCGLVYVDPPPTPPELERLYRKRMLRGGAGDYYAAYMRRRAGHERHAGRLLDRLERFRRPGRLLELGCGAGFLLACARERGWDVAGVEPSPIFARFARERLGLDVVAADLESAVLPRGAFDAVAMIDLLSHLRSPTAALERVRAWLAPGGVLLLQAGNRGEFPGKPRRADWDTPLHLFHFTRSHLRLLLEGAGFEVVWLRSEPKTPAPRALAALAGPPVRRLVGPAYRGARAAWGAIRRLVPEGTASPPIDSTVYVLAAAREDRAEAPEPLQSMRGGL